MDENKNTTGNDGIEYMFLPTCRGINVDTYTTIPKERGICKNPIIKACPASWLNGFCYECIIAIVQYWLRAGYTKQNSYLNEACTWLDQQGLKYD